MPPQPPPYKRGDTVFYTKAGANVEVEIMGVHLDDEMVPFYSVRFPDGTERQTVPKYLSEEPVMPPAPEPQEPEPEPEPEPEQAPELEPPAPAEPPRAVPENNPRSGRYPQKRKPKKKKSPPSGRRPPGRVAPHPVWGAQRPAPGWGGSPGFADFFPSPYMSSPYVSRL